jgi:hypothetical protein
MLYASAMDAAMHDKQPNVLCIRLGVIIIKRDWTLLSPRAAHHITSKYCSGVLHTTVFARMPMRMLMRGSCCCHTP